MTSAQFAGLLIIDAAWMLLGSAMLYACGHRRPRRASKTPAPHRAGRVNER